MKMFKKVIIFDLDDTLISERDYIESGFNVVAKKIAKDFFLKEECLKVKMNSLLKESSEKIFNRTLEFFCIKYEPEYIKILIELYRNHFPTIKLYDDAKEVIEYLYKNDFFLGIITDGYKESQRKKIEALKLRRLFHHIIITDEFGKDYWKPSEVPYEKMREYFKCSYENMVYIGDNLEKDFITANRLGIETIQISRKHGIYKEVSIGDEFHAKIKIKNLNEIIKLYGVRK